MLRRMTDMPAGTIGFEAIGEVEDDDWEQTVEPVLRDEIADGRNVRLLYLLGPEAREVEGDAMKADTGFRARHATSFDRVAVVSDEDWVRPRCARCRSCFPGRPRVSACVSSRPRRRGSRRTSTRRTPSLFGPRLASARPRATTCNRAGTSRMSGCAECVDLRLERELRARGGWGTNGLITADGREQRGVVRTSTTTGGSFEFHASERRRCRRPGALRRYRLRLHAGASGRQGLAARRSR